MSSSEALPIRVLKDTIPSTSPASFITGSQVIFLSFMSMIASLVNASLFTIISGVLIISFDASLNGPLLWATTTLWRKSLAVMIPTDCLSSLPLSLRVTMTLQTSLSYIILAASATKVFSSELTKSLSAKSMTLRGWLLCVHHNEEMIHIKAF